MPGGRKARQVGEADLPDRALSALVRYAESGLVQPGDSLIRDIAASITRRVKEQEES